MGGIALNCAVDSNTVWAKPFEFLVVLDPGHGGIDAGASFKTKDNKVVTEKQVTLDMARDLARELVIRGYQVVLTRNQDHEVPLADRTALANKLNAKAFISLHMNSTVVTVSADKNADAQTPHGIETYILNHASDASSRRLADLENSVLKDSRTKDAATTSQVSLIMKDMMLDANLAPSKDLACAVQNRVKQNAKDRGVRQALFYVLLGADMPSILVEAGFLNHEADRNRVTQQKSRIKLVNQIANAVDDYRLKKTTTRCAVSSAKE
jgi:N-acetylmuramoyl-L-alanine amidase